MAKWMVAVPPGVRRERAAGGTRSRVARETGGRRSAREARSPQLPPLMSPHTNYLLILSPFYAQLRPDGRESEKDVYIYKRAEGQAQKKDKENSTG